MQVVESNCEVEFSVHQKSHCLKLRNYCSEVNFLRLSYKYVDIHVMLLGLCTARCGYKINQNHYWRQRYLGGLFCVKQSCFDWCVKKCRHKLCIHDIHETTCFLVIKVDLTLASFLPFHHVILLFLTKKKLKVRNWWEGNTVISVFPMSHGRFHKLSQKSAGIHSSPACLLKSGYQWTLGRMA